MTDMLTVEARERMEHALGLSEHRQVTVRRRDLRLALWRRSHLALATLQSAAALHPRLSRPSAGAARPRRPGLLAAVWC